MINGLAATLVTEMINSWDLVTKKLGNDNMAKSFEDSGSKSASVTEMGPPHVSESYDETRGEVQEVDHRSLQRQLKSRHITTVVRFSRL